MFLLNGNQKSELAVYGDFMGSNATLMSKTTKVRYFGCIRKKLGLVDFCL
jgi:hypothetical protein